MESKDLMEILEELTKNKYEKYYAKSGEIDKLLSGKNLSKEDLLLLINILVNDDIFAWLDFISSKIEDIAEDNSLFVNLISSIIDKVKNDLSQGNFIRALISLGENKPELGIKIYDEIIKHSRKEQVILYAGLILGGVGRKQPEKIIPYLKKMLLSDKDFFIDENIKIASVRCTRVMIEKKDKLDNEDFYFDLLKVVSDSNNSESIKFEAINLNFDMFKFNKDICYNNLVSLSSLNSSDNLKYQIADRLWIWGLKDFDYEFKLIEKLAESSNQNVLSRIAYYLAKNNQHNKEKTFNIFKEWIKRDKEFYVRELDYMLEEMGKADFEYYFKKIIDWIKIEEDFKIIYSVSRLVDHLVGKNQSMKDKLLELNELFSKLLK